MSGVILSRDKRRLPTSPQCSLHLRRICGTCTHHQGALRSGIRAICEVHKVSHHPQQSATDCKEWERRTE